MRNKKQSAHRKFTISPRLRYGAMSTAIVALVIAALILINLATTNLETRYGWRGDFSFNAVTTQSETTKQILRDLKRPVKIYALFERGEEDQPLLELLNRYSAASDMVTWEQTPAADPLFQQHHQRLRAEPHRLLRGNRPLPCADCNGFCNALCRYRFGQLQRLRLGV